MKMEVDGGLTEEHKTKVKVEDDQDDKIEMGQDLSTAQFDSQNSPLSKKREFIGVSITGGDVVSVRGEA